MINYVSNNDDFLNDTLSHRPGATYQVSNNDEASKVKFTLSHRPGATYQVSSNDEASKGIV